MTDRSADDDADADADADDAGVFRFGPVRLISRGLLLAASVSLSLSLSLPFRLFVLSVSLSPRYLVFT